VFVDIHQLHRPAVPYRGQDRETPRHLLLQLWLQRVHNQIHGVWDGWNTLYLPI